MTSIVFAVVRLYLVLVPGVSLRIDCEKSASGAALVASFGYLLISGGSLPSQRAFVMGEFALCAVMLDREAISLRVVAFAALSVLRLRPKSYSVQVLRFVLRRLPGWSLFARAQRRSFARDFMHQC